MFKATYKTPEMRADAAVRNVMSSLLNPRLDAAYIDDKMPNHKAKMEREYYGFINARRDLQLKFGAEKS